tara:strand:- start:266 stop:487 length:222 start_codon:yes stop_codon:yes gene_type:complete
MDKIRNRVKDIEKEVMRKSEQMSSLHSENMKLEEANIMLKLQLQDKKFRKFNIFLYGIMVGLFIGGLIYIIVK